MTQPRRMSQPNRRSTRSIAIEPESTPWCVVGFHQEPPPSYTPAAPAARAETEPRASFVGMFLLWSVIAVLLIGLFWTVKLAVGLL